MIDEVVAGVLVNAITTIGQRLGRLVSSLPTGRRADDMALARWFDTYRLTDRTPVLPGLAPDVAERLAEVLHGDEVQAVLHELLAARLTDAPETDVDRIRELFGLTLSTADPELARYEAALFAYYDEEVCTLAGRLEGADDPLLRQVRVEALTARMIAVLHAIERHTAALATRSDPQADADFLARYRRHVAEHHGRIEPPDFERRRRVPIADLYVAPAIIQAQEADPDRRPRELDIWVLDGELDRTVLLGDPGGGKTTAASVLMHHHAADARRRVPFLVTLREFAADDPPGRSVAAYIEHKLDTFYQCPAPPGAVARLLLTGSAVVIFDGLDELLDTARRADVTSIVERFCTEYPLTPVLVTSRQVGYEQARLDDRQFVCYRIGEFGEFGEDEVGEYVRKWFAHEEDLQAGDCDRWASAFMEESAGVPDLRASPLMLALMCILYRGEGSLPRNRAEVYEQCANLLFRKWDARRRIHAALRAGHLLDPALRHLAWWLFTRSETQASVTERELIAQTASFLHGRGFESGEDAMEAAAQFVGFCRGRMWVLSDTGTTATGEPLYSFTHRTFLEYFAAAHLAYNCDSPEHLARELAPHVARNEWEVAGELAVQIKDHTSNRGAQRIYTALLGERRRRAPAGRAGVLQFLARCLRSVDPSPQITRLLVRQVLNHLLSGDTDDPTRCLPLCWLLGSCTSYRELVGDEISARIAAMVGSGDPAARLSGLRLAAYLPIGISGDWSGRGPRVTPGSPLDEFWKAFEVNAVKTHADAIIAAAAGDLGMRTTALNSRLITIDEALDLPGALSPLFHVTPMGIFDGRWAAYLVAAVTGVMRGYRGPVRQGERDFWADALEDLAAVGRYILRSPEPPWAAGRVETWPEMRWDNLSEPAIDREITDPVAYLGAAASLLISTEPMKTVPLLNEDEDLFGPLRDMRPYVMHRCGGTVEQLPILPVPDGFQQLFRDWVEHKINFLAPPPSAHPTPA